MNTQGEIEAVICEGTRLFEREYIGRGLKDTRAHLIADCIVVRLQVVLTAAEQHLVKTYPAEKGRDLLKQVRTHPIETVPGSRTRYLIPFNVNETANATPMRRRACYQIRLASTAPLFVVSSIPAAGFEPTPWFPRRRF